MDELYLKLSHFEIALFLLAGVTLIFEWVGFFFSFFFFTKGLHVIDLSFEPAKTLTVG